MHFPLLLFGASMSFVFCRKWNGKKQRMKRQPKETTIRLRERIFCLSKKISLHASKDFPGGGRFGWSLFRMHLVLLLVVTAAAVVAAEGGNKLFWPYRYCRRWARNPFEIGFLRRRRLRKIPGRDKSYFFLLLLHFAAAAVLSSLVGKRLKQNQLFFFSFHNSSM